MHLLVPLVADFGSHMFIQWEVVCNQHSSQKLWSYWKLLWLSRQQSPREAPCPSQVTPLSNNEWAVRYPAACMACSSPSWTLFHSSSYALGGCSSSWMDYISAAFSPHRRWARLTLKRKVVLKTGLWSAFPPPKQEDSLKRFSPFDISDCSEPQGMSLMLARSWLGAWECSPLAPNTHTGNVFWCQRSVNSIPINVFPSVTVCGCWVPVYNRSWATAGRWCDSFMSILTGKSTEWDLNKVKQTKSLPLYNYLIFSPLRKPRIYSLTLPKASSSLLKMKIHFNNKTFFTIFSLCL